MQGFVSLRSCFWNVAPRFCNSVCLSVQIMEKQKHFPKDQEAFLCSCRSQGQLFFFTLPPIIRAMFLKHTSQRLVNPYNVWLWIQSRLWDGGLSSSIPAIFLTSSIGCKSAAQYRHDQHRVEVGALCTGFLNYWQAFWMHFLTTGDVL